MSSDDQYHIEEGPGGLWVEIGPAVEVDPTVWLNPELAVYHRAGCPLIGDEATTEKLSQAQQMGLGPCSLCTAA